MKCRTAPKRAFLKDSDFRLGGCSEANSHLCLPPPVPSPTSVCLTVCLGLHDWPCVLGAITRGVGGPGLTLPTLVSPIENSCSRGIGWGVLRKLKTLKGSVILHRSRQVRSHISLLSSTKRTNCLSHLLAVCLRSGDVSCRN